METRHILKAIHESKIKGNITLEGLESIIVHAEVLAQNEQNEILEETNKLKLQYFAKLYGIKKE